MQKSKPEARSNVVRLRSRTPRLELDETLRCYLQENWRPLSGGDPSIEEAEAYLYSSVEHNLPLVPEAAKVIAAVYFRGKRLAELRKLSKVADRDRISETALVAARMRGCSISVPTGSRKPRSVQRESVFVVGCQLIEGEKLMECAGLRGLHASDPSAVERLRRWHFRQKTPRRIDYRLLSKFLAWPLKGLPAVTIPEDDLRRMLLFRDGSPAPKARRKRSRKN